MTDETETPEAVELPEREIDFPGRKMWVRLPRPEQLMVWQRTVKQLQGADVEGWNGHQVMAAMERARKIVDSVLVNDVDKIWLDDEMLDGTLSVKDVFSIITMTITAFAPEENRADRRAAKKAPAKKAARKKA